MNKLSKHKNVSIKGTIKGLLSLLVGVIFLSSCNSKNETTTIADSTKVDLIKFQSREIDLTPYFEGFPYTDIQPFYNAGKIFYYKLDSTTQLLETDLVENADFSKGKVISDIDYSKRNVWGMKFNTNDKHIYWNGDEKNDEVLNLYKLDPTTQKVTKITNVPYIFGWNWNKDKNRIAYIARLGDIDKRLSELRVLDLNTGKEEKINEDNKNFRYTWAAPSWQPQGRGVATGVLKGTDRTLANVAYIDFKTKKIDVITDASKTRSFPEVLGDWLNDEEFAYLSNESGYTNLYKYNITNKKITQITNYTIDIKDAELIEIGEEKFFFAIQGNPIQNTIILIDPNTGVELHKKDVAENLTISSVEKNKMLVTTNSATNKFRIDEIIIEKDKFVIKPYINLPKELTNKIINATVERVEFPTFDIDPNTGKQRMLHGFLYKPKNPLPSSKQLVIIQSFYGGNNVYNNREHILAEAGIYYFSPAPRGSAGFGKEFAALNDKDLGGNEIIDIIYAGKFISQKLGIPPQRIGVQGGSHGGYATMRILTFPGEINGTKAEFDWGFGISHAGFSDIIHFYNHCNIPDWVTLEAGDPKTEAEKLNDRSPLYHADKLKGKLLLTHGTNDNRVPIEGSRFMADSLKKYNKPFKLVEFEGGGHGISGLKNNITNYREWFNFFNSLYESEKK